MAVDVRHAVRVDQMLHGQRFIRVEFALAILLMVALDVFVAGVMVLRHHSSSHQLFLMVVMVIFFTGEAINYAVLLWFARGPIPAGFSMPSKTELKLLTLRLSGLILAPGAVALVAWRQRNGA
jgi:hypothetical protein